MPKLAAGALHRGSGRTEHEVLMERRPSVVPMVAQGREYIALKGSTPPPNPRPDTPFSQPGGPIRSIRPASAGLCVAISAESPVSRTSSINVSKTVSDVAGSRLTPSVRRPSKHVFGALASAYGRTPRAVAPAARERRGPVLHPRRKARRGPGGRPPAPSASALVAPLASCGSTMFSAAVNSGSRW